MTMLRQLTSARERIAKGWTQGEEARKVDGTPIDAFCYGAASFCALGALRAEVGAAFNHEATDALAAVIPGRSLRRDYADIIITRFNDDSNTTKANVLALYDRAIEKIR